MLRSNEGRSHRRAFAHFEIGITAPDLGAVVTPKHRNVDRRTRHVRADLGHVGRQHDGAPKHHLRTRNLSAELPDALLQNRVKHRRLAHQLPLHVQRTKAVFDLQDPATLIHLAPDGDDIAHEALTQEEYPVQIPGDLAGGKEHLHIRCGGGIRDRGKALATFIDWKIDKFLHNRIALFHLVCPVGTARCFVVVHTQFSWFCARLQPPPHSATSAAGSW